MQLLTTMKNKEKVLLALILLFFFTLFFPLLGPTNIVAAILLVGYSLFFLPLKDKIESFKQRKHLPAMLIFFIWIVISVLLSTNKNKAFSFLDPRLALFYFPLTLGSLQLSKNFRDKVLLGLATMTTVVALVCLGYSIHRSGYFQRPEFLYNDSLTELLNQQSIYISLLVNISIFVFGYFIFFKEVRYKGLMVLTTIFLFAFSYLLASRTMMLALYSITFCFCFYYIIKKKKYLEGITLLLGMLIGVFIIFKFFPQTLNRFKEIAYTKYNYKNMGAESHYNMQLDTTQWNGANFRMAAWKCGWEVFKKNPIVGVNLGDKKDELFEVYKQKDFQFALQTNKNVHNNYLDILYSLGIIGFVLFILAWIVLPILNAIKYRDGLAALIVLTFAAAWITEIYFDRNLGGMLTGSIIPFLLTYIKKERQP